MYTILHYNFFSLNSDLMSFSYILIGLLLCGVVLALSDNLSSGVNGLNTSQPSAPSPNNNSDLLSSLVIHNPSPIESPKKPEINAYMKPPCVPPVEKPRWF